MVLGVMGILLRFLFLISYPLSHVNTNNKITKQQNKTKQNKRLKKKEESL